jgi:hypothetical protein
MCAVFTNPVFGMEGYFEEKFDENKGAKTYPVWSFESKSTEQNRKLEAPKYFAGDVFAMQAERLKRFRESERPEVNLIIYDRSQVPETPATQQETSSKKIEEAPQPKSPKSYKVSDPKGKNKDTPLTKEDIQARIKKAETEAIRKMEERKMVSKPTIEETETISTTTAPSLKSTTDEDTHSIAMSLINACESLQNNKFEDAESAFVAADLPRLQSGNYEKLMHYWLSQTITMLNKYARQMNHEKKEDAARSAIYQVQRAEELREDIERILSSKSSGFHDHDWVEDFRRRAEIVNAA